VRTCARVTLVAAAATVLAAPAGASASRSPTYLETVTVMDAFNVPGRSWPSRCVAIRVSTADPRYALLTTPRRPSRACSDARHVANGYVVFRRAAPRARRWRSQVETNDVPPCTIPGPVRRDLLGSDDCL
jgi:hypothetical protein